MYALPRSNYLRRSQAVNNQHLLAQPFAVSRGHRIKQELRALGVSRAVMLTMESRYLPHIIHWDEKIQGVVYGKLKEGFGMVVATDRRVIILNKRPLFVNEDEITYLAVTGISHSYAGLGSTIILHTRIGDYSIQTLNEKCARGFIAAIESLCLDDRVRSEEEVS